MNTSSTTSTRTSNWSLMKTCDVKAFAERNTLTADMSFLSTVIGIETVKPFDKITDQNTFFLTEEVERVFEDEFRQMECEVNTLIDDSRYYLNMGQKYTVNFVI